MSRKLRELRIKSEERWPTLYQFLAAYCHEDWPIFHGTIEKAVDAAIADYSLGRRQQVLKEWRNWNDAEGSAYDPRAAVNDGFGVNYKFNEPLDARTFMNSVYEKVILSVRAEVGRDWKP